MQANKGRFNHHKCNWNITLRGYCPATANIGMTGESTDISTQKASCIVVRYYDNNAGKILSSFYELKNLFTDGVECATAAVIYDSIIKSFESNAIPLTNIVGFGSDGCNVMMGDYNSVKSRFIAACPGIHITKCIC